MKKAFFFLSIFTASLTQAQVTVTSADFPEVGDEFDVNTIELEKANIPLAPFYTGVDKFDLDLSDMPAVDRDKDVIEKPSDLSGGDQITGAEYGVAYGIGNAFLKNDGNNIEMVGLSPVLDLPLTLAFQFDSDLRFMETPMTFESTVLDSTTSSIQIPFFYDISASVKLEYEVNGYGSLKIPGDTTFDVIRLRRVVHFYAIAEQLLTSQIDTIQDSMVTWEFYTPGYSSTVMRVDITTEAGDFEIDTFALFSFYGDDVFVGSESPYNTNAYKAQVNTLVDKKLNIQSDEELSYTIFDLKGHEMLRNPSRQNWHEVNLESFESGYYLVVLEGAKGKMTKKIFKN